MRSHLKFPAVLTVSLSALATASALMSPDQALSQTGMQATRPGHVSKGAGPGAGAGGMVQRINMGVGKSIILELPRDAAEIFVGNPKVANAVVRSARKLYLIGQANGQTTVFAIDSVGQRIATIEVNIGRDILELQQILRAAIADANITARTVEDTIILTGEVSSASDAQKAIDIATGFLPNQTLTGTTTVGKVINSLTVRDREQVMVKVTVSEVQRTVMKQLGVTAAQAVGGWGSFTLSNPLSQANQVLDLGRPGTNGIGATMRALERYGVARVLAEPTVTAVSGESAKFTAGGEVPVPSGNQCTTSQNGQQVCTPGGATFKPYGIGLNFSPVVLSGGRILLRIATEVTEVDNSQAVTIGGTVVQGFRTRKNETTVELPSGGSIVSAGLLQAKSQQAINGLPGVMNLPILGALFRSREYQREETELMIIVTPYVVKPVNPADLVRPDDGFVEATDPQSWLLGRVNRLYSTTSNPQAARGFKGRVGFIVD